MLIICHNHLMTGLLLLLLLVLFCLAEQMRHAAVGFLVHCVLWGRLQHFILTVAVIYLSVGIAGMVYLE